MTETTEPETTEPETLPLSVNIAAQLEPLWRTGRPGQPCVTEVQAYAEQMTAYLAQNLEAFANARGADVFVAVTVRRGDESGGSQYRSGHYVKESTSPLTTTEGDTGEMSGTAAERTPDGYHVCPECGHHTSAAVGGHCTVFVLGVEGIPEYCNCDCYKALHGISLMDKIFSGRAEG